MTASHVFKFYRAYKFFFGGKHFDITRYENIPCPPLIEQRDRSFYYRISQRVNDATVHALFTIGFFFNPRAHVSTLATPENFSAALAFAGRAENGTTQLTHDLYELAKRFNTYESIDVWLYGEKDNGHRALIPPCIQEVISGELPLDLACLLLLIPQPDLSYHWLNSIELDSDDMGLGVIPWSDRLQKVDQLLRVHRPMWRLHSQQIAKAFWHSFALSSLAPSTLPRPEASLF